MAGSSFVSTFAQRTKTSIYVKVALITGGASGIGETTARLFARHGAKVIIADVQSELGQNVANKIQSESGQIVSYINCNVTNENDVKTTVDTVVSKHGKLDIMFNNAGVVGNTFDDIHQIEYQSFRKVMDVNVYGGLLGAKHAARVMIPEKKGCILFTASAVALVYGGTPYGYALSKHAIIGLTKNLAVDLGEHGIRVNCISPTAIATPLAKTLFKSDEKWIQDIASASACLKRVRVDANDMAEAALFLASEESKFISGMNLVVDGASNLNTRACSSAPS